MNLNAPDGALSLPLYRPRLGPSPLSSVLSTPALYVSSDILTAQIGSDIPLGRYNSSPERAAITPALRPPIIGTKRPLALAAAAAGGKLVMAIGASAAVKASHTDTIGDTVASSVMLVGGFGAALMAAIMFGNDVHALAPPLMAWTLKAVSISAALTLASSSALHQLFIDMDRAELAWVPFTLGVLGYLLLCTSLPAFFNYSEARRGQAIIRHREAITRSLGATGFACGFSWAANITGQVAVPPYVAPITLTLCATSVVLSFALTPSNSRNAPG